MILIRLCGEAQYKYWDDEAISELRSPRSFIRSSLRLRATAWQARRHVESVLIIKQELKLEI